MLSKPAGKKMVTLLALGVFLALPPVFADNPFSEGTVNFSQTGNAAADSGLSAAATTEGYPIEGNVNCRWRQNVRSGPWGKIIDGFAPGTRVKIVAREGLWYIIKHGNGYAYLHSALVDVPGTPASQGVNKSPYDNAAANSKAEKAAPAEEKSSKTEKSGGINGPAIPDCLMKGLAAAKQSKWFTTPDKCLQFAGTVAYKGGAHVSSANSIYPHNAYKPNKSLRGSRISSLDDAALAGKLKPGMLIHVKAAYDKDPAYNPVENAHHWFVYMGTKGGTPMFADCLRGGRLQTIQEIDRNMSAGRILKEKYKPYGNIRRVSAIYDPFADQR